MAGESTLRRYIAGKLKKFGQVSQIESGATSAGIPDTLIFDQWTNRDIWVELKHVSPKKKFELRITQVAWIRRRIRNGGHVFLLLKLEGGTTTYCLIKVDSETKLNKLNESQNALSWALLSNAEWEKTIPEDELIKELRK